MHCTEVRFASLLSSGFDTIAVINPPEMKLALRTSVGCGTLNQKYFVCMLAKLVLLAS